MKRLLLLLMITLTLASCAKRRFPQTSAQGPRPEMITPPYLQAGDVIGIVAVSSKASPTEDTLMMKRLQNWGFQVKIGKHLYDQDGGWYAGTDKNRSKDLQQMIDDPQVKGILFYKGGYGSVRTLDMVDFSKLRKHPKWMAGYSDVTMIHYAANKQGVETIHGTMPVSFKYDSIAPDSSAESLRDAFMGKVKRYDIAPHPLNQKGKADGRLIGGNLSLIYAASGTDVDNDLSEPSVLFIEDLAEQIYHVDRMLQNLKRSGKLSRVKAVVVGHMTDIKSIDRYGKSTEELISEYTQKLNIPVIFGFPAGHSQPNYSLYFGRNVHVEVTAKGASLQFID